MKIDPGADRFLSVFWDFFDLYAIRWNEWICILVCFMVYCPRWNERFARKIEGDRIMSTENKRDLMETAVKEADKVLVGIGTEWASSD